MISLFKNNKLSEKYSQKAWDSFVNFNYKKALNLYNKSIIFLKDDKDKLAQYFFYQAVLNKNLNNLKIANNLINKAIEIKDDNYNYYLERVEIKKLLNDKEYEKDLEKAYYLLKGFVSDEEYVEVLKVFSYSSEDSMYADNYSNMYLKINNPFKAVEVVNKFILYDRKNSLFYDLKTDILSKISDYKNAVIAISDAINNSPKNAHYYIMRTNLYINMQNYKMAKQDSEKALKLNPDEKDSLSLQKNIESIEENYG